MSITRVQYATAAASSGTTSQSCSISSTTAGNLLVAVVAVGSTGTVGGCSTPAGWSLAVGPVGTEAANDVQLYIFYMIDSAGGTTSVTFTDSVSSGITIQVWEWNSTNGWPASPLDVTASSADQATTTSPVTGTTAATGQAEELWIGGLTTHMSAGETYTSPLNGFTAESVATAGSACFYSPSTGAFYKIVSATGTANTGATAGTSKPFAGAIATFKDTPGGTPVNGSSTVLALAGILGGVAGVSALPRGINANSVLGRGISASTSIGGGIGSQGETQAASAATPSENLKGQAGISNGLSGQGETSASSQALDSSSIQGTGAFGTGQSGSSSLGTGLSGAAGVFSGLGAIAGFILGLAGQGNSSAQSAATPSLTVTGLAGFMMGLAGDGIIFLSGVAQNGIATILASSGLLGGFGAFSGLFRGLSGSTALGKGVSGSAGLNSGLSGQGMVYGSTVSLNQATVTGVGNVSPNFLAGIGQILAKSTYAVYATILSRAGLGGGFTGSGGFEPASFATPGLTLTASGAFAGNLIAGVAKLLGSSDAGGAATLNGLAGLLGGIAGQGKVQAASAATGSATATGLAGFVMGLAGRALIPALDVATFGLSTILARAGLLGGISGNGAVHGTNVTLNQATVTGAGNVSPNFLAGLAKIIAKSAAEAVASIRGTAGVGTGQAAGTATASASSTITPVQHITGSGNLAGGLIAGLADFTSAGFVGRFPPFLISTSIKSLLNLAVSVASKLSVIFTNQTTLSMARSEADALMATFAEAAHINLTFLLEPTVAKPNSTITVTGTATDINGNPVTNMATVNVTVTFPDGSTQNFTLSSGVTNAGSGKYTITYTTKAPGNCLEDWLMIDPTGNQTEYHNITPVGF